jgi:CRP/FNR family transcriptional regulator, cyclic AMP receptor protein
MRLEADMLRRAPAFAALSPAALEALALCFRERRYASGDVVFGEGDPAVGLYFLAEGELAASVRLGGMSRRIGRIVAGQLVGEGALIDPTPRAATVTAVRPSVVFEVGEEAVEILRRAAPAAARALIGAAIAGVARRLSTLEQRIERELDRVASLP